MSLILEQDQRMYILEENKSNWSIYEELSVLLVRNVKIQRRGEWRNRSLTDVEAVDVNL